jgi:short-subunit dehydrogenase
MMDGNVLDMSVRSLYTGTLQTAIDVIDDVSNILVDNKENSMSADAVRRSIVSVFLQPERRLYLGIWLVFLSFVVYFIDSST